jgi:hypothetical protein
MYSIERNHVELSNFLSMMPPSRVDFLQYYRLPEVVENLGVGFLADKSPNMREGDAATSATRSGKKHKTVANLDE